MVLPRLILAVALLLAACAGSEGPPVRPPHAEARRDELRPTDTSSSEMWRYLPSDTVEHYDEPDSGFRVHFTRAGINAVPALDANANGVPDMVESVVGVYDQVATKYQTTMGYRAPLSDAALASNGGSDRLDVYLLDFGSGADGAFRSDVCTNEKCIGYVAQENDFAGFGYPNATVATGILGSHEYFHGIQDAYDSAQGVVIAEGTAVWASEQFNPSFNDFEGFIGGYLSRPERSLDTPPPGPVPDFAYGSAIFFEFLSEKYEVAIIRKLWERLENGHGAASEPADVANPRWMVQLDALLKEQYQSSFAEAFTNFATWNLYMGAAADPMKAYANGVNYPGVAMTGVTAPQQLQSLRVFYASAQYYRMTADTRLTMGALLIDDPATPTDDETQGVALVLATRRNGVNSAVVRVTDTRAGTQTLDTSGNAQFIVAVVNTAREGVGTTLSRKPSVCIGSPEELRACRIALDPAFDAGVPDAGVPDAGAVDAGVPDVDAGTAMPPPPPAGCGCNGAAAGAGWLALALVLARRRR